MACGTGAPRRGKGFVFRAFKPVDGEVLTALYAQGTTAHYVDRLERVTAWLPPDIELIYVIMDILSAYPGTSVLLRSLAHPSLCWRHPVGILA